MNIEDINSMGKLNDAINSLIEEHDTIYEYSWTIKNGGCSKNTLEILILDPPQHSDDWEKTVATFSIEIDYTYQENYPFELLIYNFIKSSIESYSAIADKAMEEQKQREEEWNKRNNVETTDLDEDLPF